jgi:septum formation protein
MLKGGENLQLILASGSPRRKELLEILGFPFEVVVSRSEEVIHEDMPPEKLAGQLALGKALDVAQKYQSGLVIGADTIVVLENQILGKPATKEEARQKLSLLSGSSNQVITGLAVVDAGSGEKQVAYETTKVWFRHLEAKEIEWYVETGEPMDKAGAYGIQGKGSILVDKIEGCYFNVVGLPLTRLYLMLKEMGVSLTA